MPDASFTMNLMLFFAVASGILSNLTVIVVSLKGRPTVRKDEFDEHKAHDSARFKGLNEKVDTLEAETRKEHASITASMSSLVADFQRGLGRLEGAVSAIQSRTGNPASPMGGGH